MQKTPHLLQKFFNYFGLTQLVVGFRTEVISSKPTVDEIISYLNTMASVVPKAAVIAITFIVVEIVYELYVKPKIFPDDN